MSELIFGCGYLGRLVAARERDHGGQPIGVVRSATSAEELRGLGINALRADLDVPELSGLPLRNSKIFYFIPPPKQGDADTRVRNLISAFEQQGQPGRIVYLSTTGVYGDCNGEWVTEERPANPLASRAKRRWDAECRLRDWRCKTGGELVILRVAGIYGPGRLPLQRLRAGLPLVQAEESPWSNRIHVADLVQVCLAAMQRGRDGEIYNVSDGSPGTMIDYFTRLADLTGLPRPPAISLSQAQQQLSPGMLSYMQESRRLDNGKMRDELGIELQYPTMDSGLPACVRSDPSS
jgi:nucleoside-diphosphate-sugar epimerase